MHVFVIDYEFNIGTGKIPLYFDKQIAPYSRMVGLKPVMWNAGARYARTENPEHWNRNPRTWNAGTENPEHWNRKP